MRPTVVNLRDFQRSTAPCAPRPALDRGVKVPDSRTAHRDDVRAELEHGRIGASLRGSRPMSAWAWTALMVALAVLCVVVGR